MCQKSRIIVTFTICFSIIALTGFIFHNYEIIKVQGQSMAPTLHHGQFLIADKTYGNLDYSDIIIFDINKSEFSGRAIKRIAAMQGDSIKIEHHQLLINDSIIQDYECALENIEYTLNEGELFVLGDNSEGSTDSRDFGPISIKNVIAVYR